MANPKQRGGWPLPVKIALAVVVVAFIWSPFIALIVRLSNVNPSLAPNRPPSGPAPEPPAFPAKPQDMP